MLWRGRWSQSKMGITPSFRSKCPHAKYLVWYSKNPKTHLGGAGNYPFHTRRARLKNSSRNFLHSSQYVRQSRMGSRGATHAGNSEFTWWIVPCVETGQTLGWDGERHYKLDLSFYMVHGKCSSGVRKKKTPFSDAAFLGSYASRLGRLSSIPSAKRCLTGPQTKWFKKVTSNKFLARILLRWIARNSRLARQRHTSDDCLLDFKG